MNEALIGTVIASIMAVASAVYTARNTRRTQADAAAQAADRARESADIAERESQRKFHIEMLNMTKNEVEILNTRMLDLRNRLISAENETDAERTRRREMQFRVDDMTDQLSRLKRILGDVVPADQRIRYPDLFPPTTVV